jgi:hypothetical protein
MHVYPLRVRRQEETWPESCLRQTRWCGPDEALTIISESDLGAIIATFVAKQAK